MNEEKIIRKGKEPKNVPVSIRITKSLSEWLKEKNYSPTGMFTEACGELGYKEK